MIKYSRIGIGALGLSALGFVTIISQEGYSDKAIQPVKGDKWTIGHGTTQGVKPGDTITPPKAIQRAMRDVQDTEKAIGKCVKVPLMQYEYDAYVNFSYNVGTANFCSSTLVKKLNALDYDGACEELLRWTYYQGMNCALPEYTHVCGGLVTRRTAQYNQCRGNNG